MDIIAIAAAVFAARLTDPAALVFIAVALFLGARRFPWWTPFLVDAVFTALTVAIVYSWWLQTGEARFWPRKTAFIFLSFLPHAFLAYGLGRLAARLLGKPKLPQHISS